jgi:hypothetical protein
VVGSRTMTRLPIHSTGIIGGGVHGAAPPIGQCPWDVRSIQAGEHCAGEGLTGTEDATWAEHMCEEAALITAPCTDHARQATQSAIPAWNEDLECWRTRRTHGAPAVLPIPGGDDHSSLRARCVTMREQTTVEALALSTHSQALNRLQACLARLCLSLPSGHSR